MYSLSLLAVGRYSGALASTAIPVLFLSAISLKKSPNYSLVNMNSGTNSLVSVDNHRCFQQFYPHIKIIPFQEVLGLRRNFSSKSQNINKQITNAFQFTFNKQLQVQISSDNLEA